ncbi:MFS transporter [Streptomyces sp. NPDC099088]|uniref:MFS transporter n=1 Tax=Streptomyces sp. NPDC099088 TaxID=3366101 RepID=UPI0037FDDD96
MRKSTTPGVRLSSQSNTALLVVVSCQLLIVLDSTIVSVALPSIQRTLNLPPAALAWVVNIYSLAFGGLLLIGGRASDIFGRRRLLTLGLLLFTGSSLMAGLSQNASALLIFRAAQGVGAAMAAPAAMAQLTSSFPEGSSRNRALGLYTGATVGGGAIGLVAGGVLTDLLGWRWVFFVNVPTGLVVAVLALRNIPPSSRKAVTFDLAGCLTSILGLTLIAYGFIQASQGNWQSPQTWLSFLGSALFLTIFLAVERRARYPLLPLGIIANRARAGSYAVRFLNAAALAGVLFFTMQLMQNVLGYSAFETGMGFIPVTGSIFVTSALVSRKMTSVNPKTFLVLGAAISTLGLAWLSLADASSTYLTNLMGPSLAFGVGVGMQLVPANATAVSGVSLEEAGAASGFLNTMNQMGNSVGLSALVAIFSIIRNSNSLHGASEASGFNGLREAREVLASDISIIIFIAAILTLSAGATSLIALRRAGRDPVRPATT